LKVVIFAGGFGSRMGAATKDIPKPMIPVGGIPMIEHIMRHYSSQGHREFVIALGYKGEIIKEHFANLFDNDGHITLDFLNRERFQKRRRDLDWKVHLVDTGVESLTGTRLRLLKKWLGNEPFFLTYGDGLSNVNLADLIETHERSKAIVTLTAVKPPARFGELNLQSNCDLVTSFEEKSQMGQGLINGGFFICEPEVFSHIPTEDCMFEREPLQSLVRSNKLAAHRHLGFWQCADTQRDVEYLDSLSDDPPWLLK